jgi:glycosyltransferase involved in cell wall biosynthesis
MRILQITPRYFPNLGGVEIVVKKISESLTKKGLSTIVYSLDLSSKTVKEQKINGVTVKRFKPLVGDPLYLPPPNFIEAIRRADVDIIHVHNAHTLIPTFVALLKRRNPNLLLQPHYHKFGQTRIRNILLQLYKYSLDALVFARAKFVIANSPYEKKTIHEDFPHCKDVVLIREAVSLAELKSVKWNPKQPSRILYVGALRKYKNVRSLLGAFAHLVKIERKPFKLVIIGDGPEREHLIRFARKIGIEDYIEWKHNLPWQQLLGEYAEASVFVSLSPLESFSRVVHEATLIGVPAVVLNFGTTGDMVKEGSVEGVNSLSPNDVADGILKALKRPHLKTNQTRDNYPSWDKYTDQILEIYQKAQFRNH